MMLALLLNILLILTNLSGNKCDIPESFERRIEQVIKPIFKTDCFSYEFVEEEDYTSLYKLNADSLFVGYLAITSSKGRLDRFQYMILYTPEVSIKKVKLIQSNSSRVTEVTSNRWLT